MFIPSDYKTAFIPLDVNIGTGPFQQYTKAAENILRGQKDSNPEFTQRPVWSELRHVTAADLWGPFQTCSLSTDRGVTSYDRRLR